jgi:hypothetical protein
MYLHAYLKHPLPESYLMTPGLSRIYDRNKSSYTTSQNLNKN